MLRSDFAGLRRSFNKALLGIVLLLCLLLGSVHISYSQNLFEEQHEIIMQMKQDAAQIAEDVSDDSGNDETLAGLKLRLEGLSKKLTASLAVLRPRLADINAQLEQLGDPANDEKASEPSVVVDERLRLQSERISLTALISDAENTSSIIKQQITKIVDIRRNLFTQGLSQRVSINFALASRVIDAAQTQMKMLTMTTSSWWQFVANYRLAALLSAVVASLVIGFGFLVLARIFLRDFFVKEPEEAEPTYLRRLSAAFGSTVIPSAAFSLSMASAYFLFDYFNILRPDIGILLKALFIASGLIYFIHRLAISVFSPSALQWALIPLATKKHGYILAFMTSVMVAVYGIDYFFATVSEIYASPLSLVIAKSFITSIVIGAIFIAVALMKPIRDPQSGASKSWPKLLKVFLLAMGALTIISALIGYVGFARFVSQQIVVTGAFLLTMYLGFLVAKAISAERALAHTRLGHRLQDEQHFDDTTLDQLGLVIGILINICVVLVGLPLILMQLGFQWAEIKKLFFDLVVGFTVGNISISLAGILTGIILFIVGYFLTRWFQNWLDGNVMQRGRVDMGVRNSVRTIIGYIGLSLAVLVGVSAAGFNLSNLALIAGGLSLGIGFGLQTIVQNFVSGLILLTERPFKVGDWIEAGAVSGTVKKISVRATEVETFAHQSIVVPNSTLINGSVGNWTLHNKLGRIEINVDILYTPNPRRVSELLAEIVSENKNILKNPAPFISFSDMQADGFSFVVYAHVPDVTSTGGIKNELRFTIVERFADEGFKLKSCFRNEILDSKILQ